MPSNGGIPTAEAICAQAQASAGLTDFGEGEFREGLGRLLESLGREVVLTEAAMAQQIGLIKRRLVNRLQVQEWLRTHPETASVKVGPVVSITGLPRTGTTALAKIMSLEPQFRCLRSWEVGQPVPPPVLGEEQQDPRRLAAITENDRRLAERPELKALHLFDPETTEEDVELLGMSFRAQQYALPLYDYQAWWRTSDLTDAFAYHRRVIQLLQSRRPPDRWLFKAPAHCFHLEAFMAAYPNAKVIMTHRDPGKSVPSSISFITAMMPPGPGADLAKRGRQGADHLRVGVEQAIEQRKRIGEDRFFDLHHRDFLADPMRSMEGVYRFLGMELTADVRGRIMAWHAENRSGAHGQHHYTAEQFGLNADQLRADYDFYIKRFGIELEG